MKSVTPVTCEIRMQLLVAGDGVRTVPTTLVYSPADPYALHATMHTASEAIDWVFSRELLHEGLRRPSGLGDLHVAPAVDENGRRVVCIELSTPDGHAVLRADAAEIAGYLTDTFLAVPLGAESAHLDIDAALMLLVAED
jgi:hypothetical protein